MPPRGYVNLSVREDVRKMLDELRAETGIRDLSDLLILLVRTYKDYTNAISKIQELLTSVTSKTLTSVTSKSLTSNTSKTVATGEATSTTNPSITATVKGKSEERRRVIVFTLEWAREKNINIEEYMARKEKEGYLCNEASRKVYCIWREDIEQLVVDLNNSNAKMGELEKILSGERLDTARKAIEAGLLWFDSKDKRWRAPL
jgi:RecG-like helicase